MGVTRSSELPQPDMISTVGSSAAKSMDLSEVFILSPKPLRCQGRHPTWLNFYNVNRMKVLKALSNMNIFEANFGVKDS